METCCQCWMSISIHALREEGDQAVLNREIYAQDFNPRPPRGGRLPKTYTEYLNMIFQSTPSARRATRGIPTSV